MTDNGMPRQQVSNSSWVVLLVAITACVLVVFSVWALILQLAVLGVAIYRLTRRPPTTDAAVLLTAAGILVVVISALTVATIAIAAITGTWGGAATSTPLGSPHGNSIAVLFERSGFHKRFESTAA